MKRILLDMDGVLTDFDYWIEQFNGRKENGKCDWDKIKPIGSRFWADMPWLEEGRILYQMLLDLMQKQDIEIGILSAIRFQCGKDGKLTWLQKNCPEIKDSNIIICDKGVDKWKFATANDILVDDNSEIIELYQNYVGNGIIFTSAKETFERIKRIII